MKFTAALLLAAVLYLGSVDAKKRKRDRKSFDGTIAKCSVNLDKASWEAGLPVGKTMFWQLPEKTLKDGTVIAAQVKANSKWGNLDADDAHSFTFFDSDAADCAGTELNSLAIDGFTSDADGNGYSSGLYPDLTLDGADSIVGKYLQLSDSNGSVGCCMIELKETVTLSSGGDKKRRRRRRGGRKLDMAPDAMILN